MLMYKEGLVGPSAYEIAQQMLQEGNDEATIRIVSNAMAVNERREMNTFLHTRVSAGLYEFLKTREVLNQILASHTEQPLDRIAADTDRDFYMNAEEAKEYGVVDDILTKHKTDEDEEED